MKLSAYWLILLPVLFFSLTPKATYAQFDASTKMLNVGTGFVVMGKLSHPNKLTDFASDNLLPIHLSYEIGLEENSFAAEFSKNVTLGAFINFQHQGYSKFVSSTQYTVYKRWNTFNLGLTGTFHFVEYIPKNIVVLDDSKFDVYGRINAGVSLEMYKANFEEDPTSNEAITGGIYVNGVNYFPNLSISLGGRYRFSKPLAVFAELGGGSYNLLTFGLTWTQQN